METGILVLDLFLQTFGLTTKYSQLLVIKGIHTGIYIHTGIDPGGQAFLNKLGEGRAPSTPRKKIVRRFSAPQKNKIRGGEEFVTSMVGEHCLYTWNADWTHVMLLGPYFWVLFSRLAHSYECRALGEGANWASHSHGQHVYDIFKQNKNEDIFLLQ